jgi:hypothetical protein
LSLLLGPPHLIDGVVDDLDGMELVEGDGGTWQVLGSTLARPPDPPLRHRRDRQHQLAIQEPQLIPSPPTDRRSRYG